eukprot:scaffold18711_cov63-Phaeocystis_antarctica.AAC.3
MWCGARTPRPPPWAKAARQGATPARHRSSPCRRGPPHAAHPPAAPAPPAPPPPPHRRRRTPPPSSRH